MLPLPYSADIELISDMLEDLAALREEMVREEEDEVMDWGPKNQRSEEAA